MPLITVVVYSYGQETWKITGRVTDSLDQPLEQALIYVTPDSNERFLAFTYSDEAGEFSLEVEAEFQEVFLFVRYLGYALEKQPVNRSGNTFHRIRLKSQPNSLQQVIVSDKPPPVLKRADTTIYDLDQFRDSTEYNVEELIEKLPGVEVQENGVITVNGKAIEKVLVEGDDLFGRKYTLGTKNIRAAFIDKIEVIDHYQENPVLKNVNLSDAIVLNLLLKEDKKNIITGAVNSGLGYGREVKAALHANIFSISRKSKWIAFTDNGNTGRHYGIQEMEATYGAFDSRGIQTNPVEYPEYLYPVNIQNPGISSEFIDNSKNWFGSLRTMQEINEHWKIQVNGIFAQKQDHQLARQEQSFLFDQSAYQLNISDDLNLRDRFHEAEMLLTYLAPQQQRSFQSYLSWGRHQYDRHRLVKEFRASETLDFATQTDEMRQNWLAAGLFSEQLSEKSVGQVQLRAYSMDRPQSLVTENEYFPFFFEEREDFFRLAQHLGYDRKGMEMTGRYLFSSGPFIVEIEPQYATSLSSLDSDLQLLDTTGRHISLYPEHNPAEEVRSGTLQLSSNLLAKLSSKTTLRGSILGGLNRFALASGTLSDKTISSTLMLERIFKNGAEGRIQYAYEEGNLQPHYFFISPYFADNYNFFIQDIRQESPSGHQITLSYRQSEELKFRSFYFFLRYGFAQNLWREEVRFENSLQVFRPYFAQGNGTFTATAKFDQFFPSWKSTFRILPSFIVSDQLFLIEEAPSRIINRTMQVKLSWQAILFKYFNLHLDNTWRRMSSNLTGQQNPSENTVFNWRTRLDVSFNVHGWRIGGVVERNYTEINTGGRADLLGAEMSLSKKLTVFNQPATFSLFFFNLNNADQYGWIYPGDYLISRSSVEAVAPFALLNLDISI